MILQLDNGTVIKTFIKDGTVWMSWKHKEKGTIQVPVQTLEPKGAAPKPTPTAKA